MAGQDERRVFTNAEKKQMSQWHHQTQQKPVSIQSPTLPPHPLSQAGWLYTALPGLSKYQKIVYDLDEKEPIKKYYTMKCCLSRTIHCKTSSL